MIVMDLQIWLYFTMLASQGQVCIIFNSKLHRKIWFLLLCVFACKQLVLGMCLLQLTWSTSSFQKAVTSVKNAVGLICFHCIMLPFSMLLQSWEFCWRHLMPKVMITAWIYQYISSSPMWYHSFCRDQTLFSFILVFIKCESGSESGKIM